MASYEFRTVRAELFTPQGRGILQETLAPMLKAGLAGTGPLTLRDRIVCVGHGKPVRDRRPKAIIRQDDGSLAQPDFEEVETDLLQSLCSPYYHVFNNTLISFAARAAVRHVLHGDSPSVQFLQVLLPSGILLLNSRCYTTLIDLVGERGVDPHEIRDGIFLPEEISLLGCLILDRNLSGHDLIRGLDQARALLGLLVSDQSRHIKQISSFATLLDDVVLEPKPAF